MSTITELALFKSCVENPLAISKLEDLNLDKITDPTNAANEKEFI